MKKEDCNGCNYYSLCNRKEKCKMLLLPEEFIIDMMFMLEIENIHEKYIGLFQYMKTMQMGTRN